MNGWIRYIRHHIRIILSFFYYNSLCFFFVVGITNKATSETPKRQNRLTYINAYHPHNPFVPANIFIISFMWGRVCGKGCVWSGMPFYNCWWQRGIIYLFSERKKKRNNKYWWNLLQNQCGGFEFQCEHVTSVSLFSISFVFLIWIWMYNLCIRIRTDIFEIQVSDTYQISLFPLVRLMQLKLRLILKKRRFFRPNSKWWNALNV